MSTQAIRSKLTVSIRRVITDVKRKVSSEGKKKIMELKDQLLTPDQITRILSSDIDQNSCSIKGRDKMKEKVKLLEDQLNQIDDIAQGGLTTLNSLEQKIGAICGKLTIEGIEAPPTPIDGINLILSSIEPIIEILRIVVQASPTVLAASTGPTANGLLIANTNNKINLAKAKIAEFSNLFRALPYVLDSYVAKADIVFSNITKIKSQIEKIVNEIAKLKLYIIYLELDFEDKCNKLTSPTVPSVPIVQEPPILPWPEGPITLADVIAQTEELYGNLLEDLIARGDNKAIRRVYVLGAQFQSIKNTTVEVINI